MKILKNAQLLAKIGGGWVAALVCLTGVESASAVIVNGSFETGNLTGWLSSGNVAVNGTLTGTGSLTPTNGNFQATMISSNITAANLETFLGLNAGDLDTALTGTVTNGAAIAQTFTATAGESISFDFNYLAAENLTTTTFFDPAFVSISSPSSTSVVQLAQTGDASPPLNVTFLGSTMDQGETGYLSSNIVIPESGSVTLGFGVLNAGDTLVDSGLLIDNIQSSNSASVPFEFSPSLGLLLVGGLFGSTHFYRKYQAGKVVLK